MGLGYFVFDSDWDPFQSIWIRFPLHFYILSLLAAAAGGYERIIYGALPGRSGGHRLGADYLLSSALALALGPRAGDRER